MSEPAKAPYRDHPNPVIRDLPPEQRKRVDAWLANAMMWVIEWYERHPEALDAIEAEMAAEAAA